MMTFLEKCKKKSKKNKKGEMGMLGVMLLSFVVVLVGIIIFQQVAQTVGSVTDTVTLENATLGTMTNGTTIYITGYKSISSAIIFNATGDVAIPSNNYTITNNVVYNGQEAIAVTPSVHPAFGYNKGTATIDGVAQPLTYIGDSGGRAMAKLIIIFVALLIAIVALYPVYESKLKDLLGM